MLENMVVSYVAPIIQKLPDLDLSGIFAHNGVQTFIDILSTVSYFFPWDTVVSIVMFIASIYTIRVIIAFLKALWGILPVV